MVTHSGFFTSQEFTWYLLVGMQEQNKMLSFNFRAVGVKNNKHHDMAPSSVWAFTNGWENEFAEIFFFYQNRKTGVKEKCYFGLKKIQS